jgi:hypothetical protein
MELPVKNPLSGIGRGEELNPQIPHADQALTQCPTQGDTPERLGGPL